MATFGADLSKSALQLLFSVRVQPRCNQVGYPQFDLGTDGYPVSGKVIKYYREKLEYSDRDGKTKHWTQADLPKRPGVSEIMVNLMENKNRGLDSIERRRTLSTLLKIPPVLSGLGSLDQVVEIITGHDTPIQQIEEKIEISALRNTFDIYNKLFANGVSYASVHAVEKQVRRLELVLANSRVQEKEKVLRILWDYEILYLTLASAVPTQPIVAPETIHLYKEAFQVYSSSQMQPCPLPTP